MNVITSIEINQRLWPTLYSKGSKGEIRVWDIETVGNTVKVSHGVEGGKITTKETLSFGKNKGKANETTDEQQAQSEAEAKFVKQLKRGYYRTKGEALDSIDFTPMKLQNYNDHSSKIVYPCSYTTKLDGLRLLVDKNLDAQSKAGEVYTIPSHIFTEIGVLKSLLGEHWHGADGEVYAGNSKRGGLALQDIISAFRKENDNTNRLQYWIYDIPKANEPYSVRRQRLEEIAQLCEKHNLKSIVVLPVHTAMSSSELDIAFDVSGEMNEEGIVARNNKGLYEFGKRSYDAQKRKHRETTEAIVIYAEEDKNKEAVLYCQLENGLAFKCKMRKDADKEINLRLYENKDRLLGKHILVEYEDLSNAGIPLKPVGLIIREMIPGTWEPKE